MKYWNMLCFFAAAWLLTTSQYATAQMTAQPALPDNWSSDVAPGRFQNLLQLVDCRTNALSAAVVVNSLHLDPAGRYGPTARVLLATQDATKPAAGPIETATLEISGSDTSQTTLTARFSRSGTGQKLLDQLDMGQIPMGKKSAFDIYWDDEGGVTASINGGEKLHIKLAARPLSLLFIISGADATFSDIRTSFQGDLPPVVRRMIDEAARMRLYLLAAVLICVTRPSMAAEPLTPVAGFLQQDWITDVSGGQQEIQLRHLGCTVNSMRLRFRVDNTNLDPIGRLPPSIQIRVGTGNPYALSAADAEGAVFGIVPDPRTGQSQMTFFKTVGNQVNDAKDFGNLPFSKEASLSLTWTGDNVISVQLDESDAATVSLAQAPDSLLMVITGAKVAMQNIQVGLYGTTAAKACAATPAP